MRPLARSYLQHGRRHVVTGSDPIPGLGQIAFAAMHTLSPFTVTADNAFHYPYGTDGTIVVYETSDDTIFAQAATSAIIGSPLWGIDCLAAGTYIVKENYFYHDGTASVIATGYHTLSGTGTVSNYQNGRTGALLQDGWDQGQASNVTHISFEEWCDVDPAPTYVVPYCQVASGSNPTVAVQTMVIYLGPYANADI